MTKYIFAIPIILFPYLMVGAVFCIYTGFLMEELFDNTIYAMIPVLALYGAVAYCIAIVTGIVSIIKKSQGKSLAKFNMIIKLCQIPAYLVIFALGILCVLLSVWGMIIIVFLCMFDFCSIVMTGIIGAAAVFRNRKEDIITKDGSIIYGLCQFIFCADIVASVMLYVKAKKQTAAV